MKNLLLLFSSFLLFVSCQKKNNQNPIDYFENLDRGIIFGEAKEGCPHLYLLTPDGIYTDSIFSSNFDEIVFHQSPLSSEKYEMAKVLLDVPEEVLTMHISDINDDRYPPEYFLKIGLSNETWQWQFNNPDGTPHVYKEVINYLNQMADISKALRERKKEEIDMEQGIIFGEVYGLCSGDCRKLYLLKSDKIFPDANVDTGFDLKNTTFQDQPLSEEDFELAKAVLDVPESLLSHCTDDFEQRIADFDFYLQMRINNQDKIWIFDPTIDADIDADTRSYLNKMMDVARRLK